MFRLRNPLQRYAWGDLERLPRFLGVEPDGTPQAELWMGAHPVAPSAVRCSGAWVPLPELLAAEPERLLGAAVLARFGPQLPFLFKALAAAQPLSLQVHPDAAQARAGFAREQAGGTAPDDPRRSYRDANPKPELLCALDRFDVLSGLRPATEVVELLDAFGAGPALVATAAAGDTARVCGALWDLADDERRALVDAVRAAAREGSPAAVRFPLEAGFVRTASGYHGSDVGVVVGLCLNRLQLAAGQATFAPAGLLHAYLEGFGLELMANSDNVVRAGLTPKHVDVGELRRLLVADAAGRALEVTVDEHTGERCYPVLAEEFALSSFALDGTPVAVDSPGPEIVLCVAGEIEVRDPAGPVQPLVRGDSLFVAAAGATYGLVGRGLLYRARVGLLATGRP